MDILALILALLNGFLLVRIIDPVANLQPRWAGIVFQAALGVGAGIGVTSILFLLLTVTGLASPLVILGLNAVILAALVWQAWRTRSLSSADSIPAANASFRWISLLACAFGVCVLIAFVRLTQMSDALPVGNWDAWAIWNLRAKYLAGPDGTWRYAFSPLLTGSHPEYPLLLSGFIAQLWKAGGGAADVLVPEFTALLFFAALMALIVSAVALLRTTASGLLAGLVLISTTSLLMWAPAQYADVPLALYYAGAISLIFMTASVATSRAALLWAGLCASFAAWTKDEGISFLACLLIAYLGLAVWRRSWNGAKWLVAGALPGVLLTLWLKFGLAAGATTPSEQASAGLVQLLDWHRYGQVAGGFVQNFLSLGSGVAHPLVLLLILAILIRRHPEERYRQPSLIAAAVLVLVFLSYCGVVIYRFTPNGLAWQVDTAFDRLLLHLWPAAVLLFFVQLRSVADPESAAPPLVKTAPQATIRRAPKAAAGKRAK